jgi:hypothetical protein
MCEEDFVQHGEDVPLDFEDDSDNPDEQESKDSL